MSIVSPNDSNRFVCGNGNAEIYGYKVEKNGDSTGLIITRPDESEFECLFGTGSGNYQPTLVFGGPTAFPTSNIDGNGNGYALAYDAINECMYLWNGTAFVHVPTRYEVAALQVYNIPDYTLNTVPATIETVVLDDTILIPNDKNHVIYGEMSTFRHEVIRNTVNGFNFGSNFEIFVDGVVSHSQHHGIDLDVRAFDPAFDTTRKIEIQPGGSNIRTFVRYGHGGSLAPGTALVPEASNTLATFGYEIRLLV